MKPYISIVSPVYMAEKIVDELVKQVSEALQAITEDFEIILVEDGSPDNSWEKIEENCLRNKRVRGIKLSRNFGQHYAITAGLHHAEGEYVVVMDCDLQDDPKYIAHLLEKAKEGYDIVYTVKEKRAHSFVKNIFASLFNSVFNWLTEANRFKSHNDVGAFSMLSRKVVLAYRSFNDYQRHYLMVLRWLGFDSSFIKIEHKQRYSGSSSYNFSKLIDHAINGITSQSDKLLRLSIYVGLTFSILALCSAGYYIMRYLLYEVKAQWATLFIGILFSTGLILMSIGIVGIYIAKCFEQTKNRPLYLIDKILN